MYIDDIKINNFGPIEQLHFQFSPRGINLIEGQNTFGKTQLLAAIYAVFFGDEIIQYCRGSSETCNVELQMLLPHGKVSIANKYTNDSTAIYISSFDELLKTSKTNRDELYFYFPDTFDRERKVYTKEMIRHSYKFLCNLGLQSHHILGTCLAKTETNIVMSIGEERYLELMYILSQLPKGTVFLGDSIFSVFDNAMQQMIVSVFNKMTDCQFILTENPQTTTGLIFQNTKHFEISSPKSIRSPVSYNYKAIPKKFPHKTKENTDEIIVPILFCIDDEFPYEECEFIELKEIKGSNPCSSIIANAEIYINAYLNSKLNETGRIFWGVTDKRIIKGVRLSYQDKDTIQKRIAEALSKAQPYISPDIYYIKFNPVSSQESEIVSDTYIIEIGITPYHSNRLFSTAKGDVYIKTVGGKEKLTALQIQEQVILRTKEQIN